MNKRLLLSSCALLVMPTAGYTQSTGTTDIENTIVVTGSRTRDVGGVETPDTPKAKQVLTKEIIERQTAGQTILDTINLIPGVSFQNNDAYGSAGGTLTIRGFSADRVSLTFDGIQLNDSGNYAIYSNQQLDPELIEQVSVNLGSTDVDSPTASATGGTVQLRSITPTTVPGARLSLSRGDFNFRRAFGLVNTGEFGPFGTRAWVSASLAKNRIPFNNYGKINKQQYNAKIWQPIGANGDFVSLAGHYNQNRNNFFGSVTLRNDRDVPAGFPQSREDRFYNILYTCAVDTPEAGVADVTNACGTEFDRRYNPSNTGNIRGQSRFTIMDGVVLTVDPSLQIVKANGGGTVIGEEGLRDINPGDPPGSEGSTATTAQCRLGNTAFRTCVAGFYGGRPYFGRDINGDGDVLDQVTVLSPSQTRTFRPGVIANLRWNINPNHIFRVSYTLDHARHRQTGEVGLLQFNGEPVDVFPANDPQLDVTNTVLQKRDRKSYAILNRFAADYNGIFGKLRVNVGLGAPFFVRKLQNFCFTSSASGFVECTGQDPARDAQLAALNPQIVDPATGRVISGWSPPQERTFKYNKLLPNAGFVYDVTSAISAFASYSKGLSVPSTDNLYNSFFFPLSAEQAKPKPETTDSFDGGLRYTTGRIQAQLAGWLTKYQNRQASAYDPELERSVFRNLGDVDKWGFDGSFAYEPIKRVTLYAFGSWMKSKIKDNIQIGALPAGITSCDNPLAPITACAFTAGNRESGSPKYTYGLSAVGGIGPVDLGITAKRTGPRYVFDTNVPVFTGSTTGARTEIYPAQVPAYWLVNLDGRVNLAFLGQTMAKSFLQLNVYNLFDEVYVGGFGGGLNQAFNTAGTQYGNPPFVQIGAPRTFSATLNLAF